jgi:hypothetical protein
VRDVEAGGGLARGTDGGDGVEGHANGRVAGAVDLRGQALLRNTEQPPGELVRRHGGLAPPPRPVHVVGQVGVEERGGLRGGDAVEEDLDEVRPVVGAAVALAVLDQLLPE